MLIVSLTYLAETPPKLTVVFAVYVGKPVPWANCGTSANAVQVVPSTEYSTVTSLAPKPMYASITWLEFHTSSLSSL